MKDIARDDLSDTYVWKYADICAGIVDVLLESVMLLYAADISLFFHDSIFRI